MMRQAEVMRKTAETEISLSLLLEGKGNYRNETGVGFLDHMLDLFARHGRFDLIVSCKGDTHVDFHHTVEDVGIALGQAFDEALGERRGILRYGSCILPMDETLITTAVDLSGRPHLNYDVHLPTQKVGDFDTELAREFWLGLVRTLRCSLHLVERYGENSHHIIEGCFKSAGRSLKEAVSLETGFANEVPSTKGVL